MDIITCIKRVPDTSGTDSIKISESGKDIDRNNLVFKVNEWDEYVLETASQLREKFEASFTAITVGTKEWDDVLRRALAVGADQAIRIDEDVVNLDPQTVALILAKLIKTLSFDLILFGAQSEDYGSAQTGVMVSHLLGIPHATLVVDIEIKNNSVFVKREIEAGILELYSIEMPALLTIQTGINQPRYISMGGIRRAMKKELQIISLKDMDLSLDSLATGISIEKLEPPAAGKKAELITGAPDEAAGQLAKILKDAGIY